MDLFGCGEQIGAVLKTGADGGFELLEGINHIPSGILYGNGFIEGGLAPSGGDIR